MFDLNHLSILKKGQSRSINWENRKGEKGMGGRAASDLGTARKGSPCIPEIKSGETVTLAGNHQSYLDHSDRPDE